MKSNKIINTLKEEGIFIYKSFLNKDKIDELKSSFEKCLLNEKDVWRDDTESDKRIYGIDLLDPKFKEIFETQELNDIYNKYISNNSKYSFVMANKVTFIEGNLGSGGGWHRDTFLSKQLKFILYLSDVNDDNGPFEYIQKSHYKSSKLIDLAFRFTQKNIRRYANKIFNNVLKIKGKAGDLIIVDTSGIHRGSPILNGTRYALTNYLSHKPFSSSVKNQLVSK